MAPLWSNSPEQFAPESSLPSAISIALSRDGKMLPHTQNADMPRHHHPSSPDHPTICQDLLTDALFVASLHEMLASIKKRGD
jgi:hypothetical protein